MQTENTITCDKIPNTGSSKSEFWAIVGMGGVGLKWDELAFVHIFNISVG